MLEIIKIFFINTAYHLLRITKLSEFHFLKRINYRVSMSKLMRDDQYAWNEQCARDKGVIVGHNCRIFGGVSYSIEPYLIEIGDNCIVAGGVSFITHDAGVLLFNDGKGDIFGNFGKIVIGNNCYLGADAVILPDIEIGDNCLVAARAVVMNSFPPNSLIIGNPAKVASNIEFYRKSKMVSKNTIRNSQYGFPDERDMPSEKKRKMLIHHFSNLPIRKARKKNR